MSARAMWTAALLTAVAATTLLALPGCGVPEQGDPRPRAVSPSSGPGGTSVAIRIEGDGLRPRVYTDYGDGSRSFVDSGWIAELGGRRLREVRATADGALQAVVPATLPAGIHDLRVVSPSGREGILPAAYASLALGGTAGVAAFRFDPVGPQQAMRPFQVRITAVDADGNPVREFSGPVQVTSSAGAVLPATLGPFAWGAYTGEIELRQVAAAAVLTASDGSGSTGDSIPFPVGPVPAARLAFTSAPLDVAAGTCAGPLALALEDAFGFATLAAAPVTVTLSAAPAGIMFHGEAGCGGAAIAQVTIPAGEGSASVWFRGTAAGTVALTAAGAGIATPAIQMQTIRPGPLDSFAWDAVWSPVQAGVPFAVTVRALDAFANLHPYAGAADVAVLPGTLGLACSSGCPAGTTTATFVAGVWSGTVQVLSPAAGAALAVTAGPAGGTSSVFDIVAASLGTAPTARFFAALPLAAVGADATFDAAASSDAETPHASLQVSWDFLGAATGTPDGGSGWTPWSTTKTASHAYAAAGTYAPRLAVRDGDGEVSYATRTVRVTAAAADACVVDSSADTDDGTSCDGVGGDGLLTLREALKYGNGAPITFAGPMTIAGGELRFGQDVELYAPPGVELGGQLDVHADAVLSGLEVHIAGSPAVIVSSNGSLVLEDVWIHDSGSIDFSGPLAIRRSLVEGCTSSCIYEANPLGIATISGSEFRTGPGQTAIEHQNCSGSSTSLDVTTTVFSGFGTAISLSCNGSAQTRLVNNTFHANETGVAYTATPDTRHRLQNNVFTSQTTDSVTCGGLDAGTWLARDHHLLFGNAADTCVAADPDTLTSSPQYLDAAGYDFRLMPGMSPAIDSGVDAGADLNGAAPGRFHGAAPDRGARETW